MTDALLLLSTCSERAHADRIAIALVEERLAACVNIVEGIESIFRWKGNIERASEVLLLIKTTAQRVPQLRERLAALHSYDTPEIIVFPIADGSEKYLAWLREQVSD